MARCLTSEKCELDWIQNATNIMDAVSERYYIVHFLM